MDCQLPTIRYTEFSKLIHKEISKTNVPISGAFEVTLKCNMKCTHCYIPKKNYSKDLTKEEIYKIIDQFTDQGCLWILVTGGEPLLRKDFLEIYDYMKRKGLLITLFTNGTLITKKIADHLKKYPPFSIEISIYGSNAKTHERITQIPGSFEKCMDGIKLLLERGLPLKLKTMGLKSNMFEIQEIKKLAKNLGVSFRFDPLINPSIDGTHGPLKERLAPEEVIRLEKEDDTRSSEWKKLCRKYYGYSKSDYVYTCGAGRNYFHIDPFGKLNMCVLLRIPGYDLKKGSFIEGYNTFRKILDSRKTIPKKCFKCKIGIMCGLCPGWSVLEKGDAAKTVDYLCRVAHLRAQYFSDNGRKGVRKCHTKSQQ